MSIYEQTDIERLCTELKFRGIPVSQFQKQLNIKSQHWNNWRMRGIPSNRMFEIAKELNINPTWLASGEGSKITAQGNNEYDAKRSAGYIPMIKWSDTCKPIKHAEDWIVCPSAHGNQTFALVVESDAMVSPYPNQKSYQPGSIIFVDPDKIAESGSRVVAHIKNRTGIVFKELQKDGGRSYLKALNPAYPLVEIDEETEICGVVIGQFQPE